MSIQKHKTRNHVRGGAGLLMMVSGIFFFAICFVGAVGSFAIFILKLKGK